MPKKSKSRFQSFICCTGAFRRFTCLSHKPWRNWLLQAAATGKWLLLIVPMAMLVGSSCAFFLWSLDRVTQLRFDNPWLLYLLPVGGLAVGLVYHRWGRSVEGGNNLIMDQIHEVGGGVPRRMAPLVLLGTLVTHLFGGSAGREGTAVQMGGSIASGVGRLLRLGQDDLQILLMGGVAAGFGGVFGTPLAGAVFALEVLMIGRIEYKALLPCLIAAVTGDWACHAWGVGHIHYHIGFTGNAGLDEAFKVDGLLLGKVVIASAAFGMASSFFSELSHSLHTLFKRLVPYAPLRPALGGMLIIGMTWFVGTSDYLGIGVTNPDPHGVSIVSFFTSPEIHPWAWWWKILFTAVTLACGFKGGEVTPLFFIGAALGNVLAGALGAPTDLFAALGFVAIFAGATNTPLACTLMGVELFGAGHAVYIATACWLAYLFSGHSGIYLSQRVAVPKSDTTSITPDMTLRHVREIRPNGIEDWTGWFVSPNYHEFPTARNPNDPMPNKHKVSPHETGLLRIYLKPSDRRPRVAGLRGLLGSRPLYRELVDAAKQDGFMNAVAYHTHYGFSNHGLVQAHEPEIGNPSLTMCVELVGEKARLERFCQEHGELLRNKVILYKHIEHWMIHDTQLEERDASAKDLRSGGI